jgi:hypothetical protein
MTPSNFHPVFALTVRPRVPAPFGYTPGKEIFQKFITWFSAPRGLY